MFGVRVRARLRLGGGVVGSVLVATPGSGLGLGLGLIRRETLTSLIRGSNSVTVFVTARATLSKR